MAPPVRSPPWAPPVAAPIGRRMTGQTLPGLPSVSGDAAGLQASTRPASRNDASVVRARRKYVAETKFIQIVAGAQALLAAWAILTSATAGTQPLMACKAPAGDRQHFAAVPCAFRALHQHQSARQ